MDELIVGKPFQVAATRDLCGEGAVWHDIEQSLYWTDINGFRVHRWEQSSHRLKTWKFGEPVTAINLTTQDEVLIVVTASRVLLWRPRDDRRTEFGFTYQEWPDARCNDARVGPDGSLWIASMQNNVGKDGSPRPITRSIGRLFRLNPQGKVEVFREGLGIGNTIAWSPDGRSMYSGDTLADQVLHFNLNPDNTFGDSKIWSEKAGPGLPDGSSVDSQGFLWNCRHGGACILRIGESGMVERIIELPVRNPTTCVFGGEDGTTLFVTSAILGDEANPQAGCLFALSTNLRGLPPNRFPLDPSRLREHAVPLKIKEQSE